MRYRGEPTRTAGSPPPAQSSRHRWHPVQVALQPRDPPPSTAASRRPCAQVLRRVVAVHRSTAMRGSSQGPAALPAGGIRSAHAHRRTDQSCWPRNKPPTKLIEHTSDEPRRLCRIALRLILCLFEHLRGCGRVIDHDHGKLLRMQGNAHRGSSDHADHSDPQQRRQRLMHHCIVGVRAHHADARQRVDCRACARSHVDCSS